MIPLAPKLRALARRLAVLVVMAMVTGTAAAGFLWSLDAVTRLRFSEPRLLWFLPVGGFLVAWMYRQWGRNAGEGNNLLIDEMRQPGAGVPRRMAPLVLFGTLVTHLFGGSAGREGTAVQMGGGIAAACARMLGNDGAGVRLLLMAGVAAGFGAVFGTPVAGAVFAVEWWVVSRIRLRALVPCFIAAMVAHWTCLAWGVGHTNYQVAAPSLLRPDLVLLGKTLMAAVLFGVAGAVFARACHGVADACKRIIPRAELRPVAGGLLVIGLYHLAGTPDYLGLGVLADRPGAVTLPAMFVSSDIPASAWLWKLVFTAVTVGAGFKGGEVTPLFFIGAALGNAIAQLTGAPVDLFAALGFTAIFAAATKTPLASTLLGIELFGPGLGLHLAAACFIARHASGHRSIYRPKPAAPDAARS